MYALSDFEFGGVPLLTRYHARLMALALITSVRPYPVFGMQRARQSAKQPAIALVVFFSHRSATASSLPVGIPSDFIVDGHWTCAGSHPGGRYVDSARLPSLMPSVLGHEFSA